MSECNHIPIQSPQRPKPFRPPSWQCWPLPFTFIWINWASLWWKVPFNMKDDQKRLDPGFMWPRSCPHLCHVHSCRSISVSASGSRQLVLWPINSHALSSSCPPRHHGDGVNKVRGGLASRVFSPHAGITSMPGMWWSSRPPYPSEK